jgi:ankyrin repeat protein
LDFAWDKILEASVPPSFSQALQDTFPSAGNLEDRNFSKLHKIILGLDSGELGPTLQGSRSSIDSIDKDGRSALHWVADRGEASMLNSLLRCGADPNLASFEGRTPLHRAAIAGSLECVEFLLAAGAETTPRDRWGKTPLHRGAIFHDDLKFLDPLIASGCDINATDMFGDTPLAYAARTNKARAVSYLLDHGANIDQRCDLGYTAVLNATERNSHNALLLLLERGAQPRITTIGQNSILHIVAEHGDVRTMEIFTNLKLCNLDAHAKNTNGETALDILKRRIDRPSEITEAFEGLLSSVGREDGSNDPVCQPTDDGDDGGNEDVPEFVDALEEPQC